MREKQPEIKESDSVVVVVWSKNECVLQKSSLYGGQANKRECESDSVVVRSVKQRLEGLSQSPDSPELSKRPPCIPCSLGGSLICPIRVDTQVDGRGEVSPAESERTNRNQSKTLQWWC